MKMRMKMMMMMRKRKNDDDDDDDDDSDDDCTRHDNTRVRARNDDVSEKFCLRFIHISTQVDKLKQVDR